MYGYETWCLLLKGKGGCFCLSTTPRSILEPTQAPIRPLIVSSYGQKKILNTHVDYLFPLNAKLMFGATHSFSIHLHGVRLSYLCGKVYSKFINLAHLKTFNEMTYSLLTQQQYISFWPYVSVSTKPFSGHC